MQDLAWAGRPSVREHRPRDAYVTRKEHVLVNTQLFIPQEWNDDPKRYKRAHIPEKEYEKHKIRHRHCLGMLDEQGELLPHGWIAGDEELGQSSPFRRERRKRNEQYVLAVLCNTTARPDGGGLKYDYYLSNALSASPDELARVIL